MTGDALRLHTRHIWTTDAAAWFTARWAGLHAQEVADEQKRVTRRFHGRIFSQQWATCKLRVRVVFSKVSFLARFFRLSHENLLERWRLQTLQM